MKSFTIQHGGWQPFHLTRPVAICGRLSPSLFQCLYLYIDGTKKNSFKVQNLGHKIIAVQNGLHYICYPDRLQREVHNGQTDLLFSFIKIKSQSCNLPKVTLLVKGLQFNMAGGNHIIGPGMLPPVEGYLLSCLKIPITGLFLYIEGTDIEFI